MKRSIILISIGFIAFLLVLCACKKDDIPTLSTSAITNITATSASSGGNITSDGGAGVTVRGVCWGVNANPTTLDSKTNDGNGAGQFVSTLSGLTAGSTFHVRAYATNSVGTAYGVDVSFATLGQVPEAVTQPASNISTSGATLNGTVNANYLSTTASFEYGTTAIYGNTMTAIPSPVTGNTSTNVSASISGLYSGTIYHFRIIAINSIGTTTGSDLTFKTISINILTLTTTSITSITLTSVVSGGNITNDGGEAITARGVCWSTTTNPTIGNSKTSDGIGTGNYTSNITGLTPGTTYYLKAYATNSIGTAYGDEKSFKTLSNLSSDQIIADHTIVDRYDDIPQYYIDKVKEMWLVYAGESHALGVTSGTDYLKVIIDPKYASNYIQSGTPDAYTNLHLRISKATWGDLTNATGWIYDYGEEDWFTSETAVARTKAGIAYCNASGLTISAMGFGWCSDMMYGSASSVVDPVFGCYWYGASKGGPQGDCCWGLDDADNAITGNTINMNTYLNVTQQYIDYCTTNNIHTKVFFTTGTVDPGFGNYDSQRGYQNYLKDEYIRNYVKANSSRILFDYADILTHDSDRTPTTQTWNGHTFPYITPTNLGSADYAHISQAGCIRLGKAMWWMLARMAGWDGK